MKPKADGTAASGSFVENEGGLITYRTLEWGQLWAYSTQDSCWHQEQRRVRSNSWFAHSDCPLVWGWNPDDWIVEALICRQNSLQNRETNWGALSETTSTRRPWIQNTWSTNTCAVSLVEGSLGRGMKWATLEKRYTTEWRCCPSIQGGQWQNQGPSVTGVGRDGQRVEQTNRRRIGSLDLSTHRAGSNKLTDILGHGRPPESLTDGSQWPPDSWVAGQPGWVTPLDNFRAQFGWNKQAACWNPHQHWSFQQSLLYLSFDVPGEGCHYHLYGQNGVNGLFLPWGLEQMGECIGLDTFGPGSVRQGEIESAKEEDPVNLLAVSWPNGYIQGFDDPFRPGRAEMCPQTSDAIPPKPAWLPTTPDYLCCNSVLRDSGGERRHRDAPSHPGVTAVIGPCLLH